MLRALSRRGMPAPTVMSAASRVAPSIRRFAAEAEADAKTAEDPETIRQRMRTEKKARATDPFTSTLPLTELVHVPTKSGKRDVFQPTHTKLRLRDRRVVEYMAHRFDENGNRKWSNDTHARRNRGHNEPWSLSASQLMYLRLYGNPKLAPAERPQAPKTLIQEVEKEYTSSVRAQYKMAIPDFNPGDKIRITKYLSLQKEKFEEITGIVLARFGREGGRMNASFTIRNRLLGEGFEMTFPLYSPFIKKIEVVTPAAIRRRNFYFLRKGDPNAYMV